MRPRTANLLLGVMTLGIIISLFIGRQAYLYQLSPLPKRPEVLEDKARELLARVDLPQSNGLKGAGFLDDYPLLRWIADHDPSPDRWNRFASGKASAISYWYRQVLPREVPQRLGSFGRVNRTDPPFESAGMSMVVLDETGRLTLLAVIPPRTDSLAVVPDPIGRTGLPRPDLIPVDSRRWCRVAIRVSMLTRGAPGAARGRGHPATPSWSRRPPTGAGWPDFR